MARGKHAASASLRRAQSAEDQLDRLLPQLIEAKRVAKQNKSEADRAIALAAEVKALRSTVGIPIDEHAAAVAALSAEHDEQLVDVYSQFDNVVAALVRLLKSRLDQEDNWLSAFLLDSLRALPADRGANILRDLGLSREASRAFLEPGCARWAAASNSKVALNLGAKASALGLKGIPRDWVDDIDRDEAS
jgi:hypothetical protein